MKVKFQELGIEDKLVLFSNGKEVVEYFMTILNDSTTTVQPVSLLLLDINMPIYDGIQAIRLIKESYQRVNEGQQEDEELNQIQINTSSINRTGGRNTAILRPFTAYLSQIDYATMQQFVKVEEQADCYIEKPV